MKVKSGIDDDFSRGHDEHRQIIDTVARVKYPGAQSDQFAGEAANFAKRKLRQRTGESVSSIMTGIMPSYFLFARLLKAASWT